MTSTVPKAFCGLLLSATLLTSALADAPSMVRTRPDPFEKLSLIDAGRMASTWSSLPEGLGCITGDVRFSGHAMLLAESADAQQPGVLGEFSLIQPRHRMQLDASARHGCVFGQLAVQRQLDPAGDYWSWDGSALSWRIDKHWRIGAGRIARQWGPAWDGSLILGTAARPFANLSVEAASGVLARDGFWWWLGEVDFSAFFGELEDDRGDYPRPYLMGSRLVVRPWPWLELGASRTAMWGGEGRDNSLKAFWTAVSGRDNQSGDPSQQPGNQLGGFDARWDLSRWVTGVALYGQMIGEDEAASLPSKYMYLAGMDWRHRSGLAYAEWTDSKAKLAGVAYNHHIYTDGYRHRGRPLGYWGDGDSNLWTVGGLLHDLFGGQALAVLRYGTLNDAGASPTWPNSRLASVSLQWRKVFDGVFGLTVALDHVDLSRPRPGGGDDGWRDTQARVQFDAWLH